MRSLKISIQEQDFSIEDECTAMRAQHKDIGALATFTGLVREMDDESSAEQEVSSLYVEHYPGMTEKNLEEIAEQANQQWPLLDITIIHRIGELKVSEQIVFVGVSSMHREAAFAACTFIMDFLKTKAAFWKKSNNSDNAGHWVEAKESDSDVSEKWAEAKQKR
ncbi:MAG: molybdenum cofactor biosynthesis protein MoaE [Gammaproteobacteria bacterium]|jgi:molybdopterin synthase catalytic subunit|nr:molybdenum cofactor biosynthesis protein MoaE [Gammaproteobacteria bacterium]